MSGLRHRSARAAWLWCLLYTWPVPAAARERRRGELYSHLWEHEAAGLGGWPLVSSTLRGAFDDLTWSLARGGPAVLSAPGTWVGLAASLPIATLALGGVTAAEGNLIERTAMFGSLALLALSAVLGLRRRR